MKGSEMQRIRQVGEYLVAAKLIEMGWHATTFTGNIPRFDIIATHDKGKTVKVQVKTIKSGDWQFNMRDYAKINFDKERRTQEVGPKESLPHDLFYVFVKLDPEDVMNSKFYVMSANDVQDMLVDRYTKYLHSKHMRRDRWDSTHCILREADIQSFKDRWELIGSQP
jgi:hypothetical protein